MAGAADSPADTSAHPRLGDVMWGRKKTPAPPPDGQAPQRLRDALRQARIETAERTGVVVDLRDAVIARLEILNEALDPLFAEVPEGVDLFDRGIARGEVPRLWIDLIAHVDMGRDNRTYRFVQDSRYGRRVLAESAEVGNIIDVVSKYVARRIVEREQALVADQQALLRDPAADPLLRRRARRRAVRAFIYGLLIGGAGVIATLVLLAQRLPD
jgi:hypothetical protein